MNSELEHGELSETLDKFGQRAPVRHLSDAALAREVRVAQMILKTESQERFWHEARGAAGFG